MTGVSRNVEVIEELPGWAVHRVRQQDPGQQADCVGDRHGRFSRVNAFHGTRAHRTAIFDDEDSCSQPASADMVYQGMSGSRRTDDTNWARLSSSRGSNRHRPATHQRPPGSPLSL